MEDLHRAQTELNAISQECEQLKQLAELDAGSQIPWHLPSQPGVREPQGFANDTTRANLSNPPPPSSITDSVDGMTEAEAKQKLKVGMVHYQYLLLLIAI